MIIHFLEVGVGIPEVARETPESEVRNGKLGHGGTRGEEGQGFYLGTMRECLLW